MDELAKVVVDRYEDSTFRFCVIRECCIAGIGTFQRPVFRWVVLFHYPVQPFEPLPDLLRSRQRLPCREMCADEAPEVDDDRLDVGHLPGRRPLEVPVALRLQHRVEQVDVLLRKDLRRWGLGPLLREDGQVGDTAGRDDVEGDALAQVVGMLQPADLDPRSCFQRPAGLDLDRSTLAGWVGKASFHLKPVADWLAAHLKRSSKLFMDETRVPALDPGRGRTKTG